MHIPVLLDKVVSVLEPLEGKTVLDATLGGGGHAAAVLDRMGPAGKLIGIDQDADALAAAKERLVSFGERVSLFESNFSAIKEVLSMAGVPFVDGVIMDLGLSSLQLDEAERGFSFSLEGPLDMRMDRRKRLTAKELVNTLEESKLGGLLREYGEERFAKRIASAIVHSRSRKPISTTRELAEIVERSVPRKAWPRHIHPATRTFQALRIVVNGELDNLREGLNQAVDALAPGGKLLVISYHSLEDRIVKHGFKAIHGDRFRILTKKPLIAEEEEIARNPRSRSAKLRVLERAA